MTGLVLGEEGVIPLRPTPAGKFVEEKSLSCLSPPSALRVWQGLQLHLMVSAEGGGICSLARACFALHCTIINHSVQQELMNEYWGWGRVERGGCRC